LPITILRPTNSNISISFFLFPNTIASDLAIPKYSQTFSIAKDFVTSP
jgi:hypothetical protein